MCVILAMIDLTFKCQQHIQATFPLNLQLNLFLCFTFSSSSVPRGSHPLRELQGEPLPGPLPPVPSSIGDELQQEPSPWGGGTDFLPEGDDQCLMQFSPKYISIMNSPFGVVISGQGVCLKITPAGIWRIRLKIHLKDYFAGCSPWEWISLTSLVEPTVRKAGVTHELWR